MDKKMLKSIPVNKFNLGTTALSNLKLTYFINAYVRNKILILDVYDTSSELQYRIFQIKTEFITLEGNKWRESKLINLLTGYHYTTFVASKESEKVIQKYLGAEGNALDALKSTQESIRKAELDNRHKAELNLIDSYMKPVKAVPKDFEKWLNDVALIKSRYIIYEYKKTAIMPGRCTHCKSDVLVHKPKHNLQGVCPKCKSKVTFKSWGKFNTMMDRGTAQLVQKHPEGVVVREFAVTKTYTRNHSELSYLERNRTIIGKEVNHFAWESYKQSGPIRWCKDKRYWDLQIGPIYTKNLKRELKGTNFLYSGLEEMIESGHSFRAIDYLEKYNNGPALEYLSKLKLFNLVKVLIGSRASVGGINLQGKTPLDVLKISKKNLNRAMSIDANYSELRLLQVSENEAVSIPDELFRDIAREYSSQLEDFIRISKLSNVHQLFKYLETKKVNFRDYRDYIDMATELRWDVKDRFILFPRYFKEAHDQAMELTEIKETYEENLIIEKMYKDLRTRFEFRAEEYMIRLPRTAKEIIREGHELHHCVSRYVKAVASGKTLILLIRKADEPHKPYYTLEINPKDINVRQVRGERNKSADDSIRKLLDEYKVKLERNLNQIGGSI